MRKKRMISCLLILTMLVGLMPSGLFVQTADAAAAAWDGSSVTQPGQGTGTPADPYQIGTGAELAWFSQHARENHPDICGRLTADIDLGGHAFVSIYGGTTEIEDDWETYEEDVPYTGTFDGGGHVISGYESADGGLFRLIQKAVIKNLGLTGSITSQSGSIGSLVDQSARGEASTVSNCFSRVSMTPGPNSGGLVGNANSGNIQISDCYYTGRLTPGGSYPVNIGGIAGNLASSSMTNCYTTYKTVAGKANGKNIKNCYYVGSDGAYGTGVADDALKAMEKELGAGFAADGAALNDGYPILAWQAPAVAADTYDWALTVYPKDAQVTVKEQKSGTPLTAKREQTVTEQSFYECTKRVYELKDRVSYTYTVEAPGYFSVEETLLPDGQQPNDVTAILREVYTLTFGNIPENGTITLTSETYGDMEPTQEDPRVYCIPEGRYTYTVTAEGYEDVTDGEIDTDYFHNYAFTENVYMKPVTHRVTFAGLTPANARLTVAAKDGAVLTPVEGLAYDLAKGEYTWTASCEGYVAKSGSFTVTGESSIEPIVLEEAKDKQTVTFEVTGAEDYTVTVTGASSGAEMQGTGKVWALAAGSYRYTVAKAGYTPVQGAFTVTDTPVTIRCALVPAGTPWDGTDTPVKPETKTIDGREFYVIKTPGELIWFADRVNDDQAQNNGINAFLAENLDLGGHPWKRIGTYDRHFAGIFEGNGKTISGLAGTGGLFYSIDKTGIVRNLAVHGMLENKTVGFGGGKMGFISNENYGTIENCDAYGTIIGGGQWLGGITALNYAGGRVTGCSAHGSITTNYRNLSPDRDSASAHAGGLVGKNYGTVENSYCTASVTNDGTNQGAVGGIAGSATKEAVIKNVYAVGTIRSNRNGGGVVGYAENAAGLTNLYGCQDSAAQAVGNLPAVGTVQSAQQMRTDAFVVALRGDGAPFNKASGNSQNMGFPVLNRQGGTAPDVQQLEGWEQLQAAKNALKLQNSSGEDLSPDDRGVFDIDRELTLKLPDAGEHGVSILWSSDDAGVVDTASGVVTLPAQGDRDVKLTATLSVTNGQDQTLQDTRVFTLKVWSVSAKQAQILDAIATELNGDLARTWFHPSWEANDRNVVEMMRSLLEKKGYAVAGADPDVYDVKVTLKNIGQLVYGNPEQDYIADDGTITYFFENPKTWAGVNFAQRRDMTFTLTLGDQSVDVTAGITIPWDMDKVTELMDQYIQQLTWDDIRGDNTNASKPSDGGKWPWSETVEGTVSKDLTLPRMLPDFPFAQVRWYCFKPNLVVTQVSEDENAPLAGRVVLTKEDTDITLTAEMVFTLTDADSAPITTNKTFVMTIKGSGTDPETQSKRLEQYPALLRDSINKEQNVDSDAVIGDIQLPTPTVLEKAGIMDRQTERVTVTSGNTDVLEINGYRAVVYRPLPGGEPVTVTYTVNISDRSTNAVTASRDFTLTIQPLTQEEIDGGLALMERVKGMYFDAIRGDNPSADGITENLKPFAEAVAEGNDIKFIRGAAGLTFSGIIADELPGYDSMAGQSWRLFRSDRPLVIEDEVLRVHRQQYDTAVTVDSVLTHGVYGKYWKKFSGTDNASDYAQFAALYKQPVQAAVTVKGTDGGENPNPEPQHIGVTVAIDGGNVAGFRSLEQVRLEGLDPHTTTAWDALRTAMSRNQYQWKGNGGYVSAVTDPDGVELAEAEHGPKSGWMYTVNGGNPPDKALNQYYLSDGDTLRFYYNAQETVSYTVTWKNADGTVLKTDKDVAYGTIPEYTGDTPRKPADRLHTYVFSGWSPEITAVTGDAVYTAVFTAELRNPFRDVQEDDYYFHPVIWAAENGITAGVAEDRFAPYEGCTRGQVVTFLWAAAGRPQLVSGENPFTDVAEDDYYCKAVLWAAEKGITAGVSATSFAPEEICTRAQIVTFLWAAAGRPEAPGESGFADVSTEAYYADAVAWAAGNGVTAGVGENCFGPLETCIRGQVVTFLYKAQDHLS